MCNYISNISEGPKEKIQNVVVIRKSEAENFDEKLKSFLGENITESYEKFVVYLIIIKGMLTKTKQLYGIKGIEVSSYVQKYSKEVSGILVDISGKNCLFVFVSTEV